MAPMNSSAITKPINESGIQIPNTSTYQVICCASVSTVSAIAGLPAFEQLAPGGENPAKYAPSQLGVEVGDLVDPGYVTEREHTFVGDQHHAKHSASAGISVSSWREIT